VVDEEASDAGSDGSHADQGDFRDLHGKSLWDKGLRRNQSAGRNSRVGSPMLFGRGAKRQADGRRRFAPRTQASLHWATFRSRMLLARMLPWLLRLNAPNVANN
jgi:hypothetical protein